MKIEHTIEGVRECLMPIRQQGARIGFVPTMGNLHDGHLQLVQQAKRHCDQVVVSIFVNPIQFGEGEDFERYPRTLDADCELLRSIGCDIVFAPTVHAMYGQQARQTTVSVCGVTEQLCGQSRPGHFDGVATVVCKLFNIVQPTHAFFGEKDWQQLTVIRSMVNDLNIPVNVIGVPIVRAADGLALSSRNGYLTPEQRAIAPQLYQALLKANQQLSDGMELQSVLAQLRQKLSESGFIIDYVSAYTPDLQPVTASDRELMLFVAAKLGQTRLIDNLHVQREPHIDTI